MTDTDEVMRKTAIGLLAAGAILLATGTVAFTDISGSRTAAVGVTNDSTAYLSIENAADASKDPVFTDLTSTSDLQVTLSSTDPDFDSATPSSFTLAPGGNRTVQIDGSDSTVTVDVTAELFNGGRNVGNIELQRAFAVPQAGQIELTPNVNTAGSSGKYSFELNNTGDINVTLDGISVDSTTNPDADRVARGNILTASGTQVVSQTIDVGGPIVGFDQNVDINTGQVVPFEFDKFSTPPGPGKPNADMRGENVTITVRFTDGSTRQLKLVP